MGNLKDAWQAQRKVSGGRPSAFVPTQPGDKDFSLSSTPNSQAQYPAAAAEYRFYQNQRAAQNRLADSQRLGLDVTGEEFDPLQEAAKTGFTERALTLGENLIGWIDGPRQFMNMFVQDMVGGNPEEGFESPGLSDYLDALGGGIEDHAELENRTGLKPISGSHTLDMFGWAPEEHFWGRVGRGVADFGLQILIDPVTYLTGGLSGLGRKVAQAAGRELQEKAVKNLVTDGIKAGRSWNEIAAAMPEGSYLRSLAKRGESLVDEMNFDLQKWADEFDGGLPPDVDEALGNWLGKNGMEAAEENLTELAIARAVGDDVLKPLGRRDFKAIDALARHDLPAYARGGLRISVPFTKSSLHHGVDIPGTVGLGKEMIGDPLRKISEGLKSFGPYKKLANKTNDLIENMGDKALLDAIGRPVAEGGITSWQYYIAASGLDKVHNTAARRLITKQLNNRWAKLEELALEQGIDDVSIFHEHILNRLEGSNVGGDIMDQIMGHLNPNAAATGADVMRFGNNEIDKALDDLVGYTAATFEDYHRALAILDPSVKEKFFDGYIPHRRSTEGRDIVSELASKGGAVEKRLIQRSQQEGNPAYSIAARMIAAEGGPGRMAGNLGYSGYFNEAGYGRQQAIKLTSDGSLMLDEEFMAEATRDLIRNGIIDEDAMGSKQMPISILNEILEPVFRELADEFDVVLPKAWSGKMLNDNPLELLVGYVESLEEVIGVWDMINSLKTAGLAFRHDTGLAIHDTVQAVMGNMARRAEKVAKGTASQLDVGKPTNIADDVIDELASAGQLKEVDDKLLDGVGINTALNDWAGDSKRTSRYTDMLIEEPQTFKRLYASESSKANKIFMREALLLMRHFDEKAEPLDTLMRVVSADEAKAARNLTVGDTFDISMRSASEGHGFLQKVRQWEKMDQPVHGVGGIKHTGVEFYFDEGTRGIKNVGSYDVDELEVLVSGRFTVKEILDDPKSGIRAILLGEQTDILSRAGKALEPELTEGELLLRGFDDAMEATIPMPVLGALRNEALPVGRGRFHEVKELLEISKMSKEDFMSMTPATYKPGVATAPFKKGEKFRLGISVGTDDVQINVEFAPGQDRADAMLDAIVSLDQNFKTGALKNRYSPDLVREIMSDPATTEETAELLFEYGQAKMMGLPDRVKEFFNGGEAAEIFDTRIMYNAWEDEYNTFARKVAAIQTESGTLAKISQYDTATQEILRDLQHLRKGARELGERGYDEILKAFKGADVFTRLATHKGFVSPGIYGLAGPAVDSLQIHAGMGKYMRNMARNAALMHTPEGIAAAKVAAREGLRWWRAMATIARPTFHIRNLVGGTWMNMLHDVKSANMAVIANNMPAFRRALGTLREPGADILEEALKELPSEHRALFRAMWDEDILSGFVSTEFRKLTRQEKSQRLGWLNIFDVDNFLATKIGGNTMQGIEDLLRGSLFARYFDPANPGSSKVARDMVNAVHFDYVHLTPLETKLKSYIPFFVWTRRNLPRQIQMAVENPRTVQKYRAMMQAMSDNFGGSEETLPEGDHFSAYAAGTDYYTNENSPFWARFMIDPDLPIHDMLDLPMPSGPALIEWANNLLGPHISTLTDINSQRDFGDVNAPAPFNVVLKSLASVGLYDETTDGDVRVPYHARTLMETAFPMMRELATPLTGGPTDPNRQARLGIEPGDPEWMQIVKSLGYQTLSGAGIKLTTPADARGVAARSNADLDALIKELRLQGKQAPGGG